MEKEISSLKQIPIGTAILTGLNAVVYIMLIFLGNTGSAVFMAQHGALYPELVIENGEWWRLITAMFLHFDPAHLVNNMLIFCCIGSRLEKVAGTVKMLITYFVSGILGNLLSLYIMYRTGNFAVSAGASGAVYGMIGAFLWIVILHHGHLEGISIRGILLMLGLSLYYGFTATNIDNWGHLGGLVSGFFIMIILYRRKRQKD